MYPEDTISHAATHFIFGSIVYNRTIVYKLQNFLKEAVHVIIIWLNEIQAMVIYSHAILVAVTSECYW